MNPKGKVKKLTKNYLAKELESDSLIGISKLGEKNKILQTLNVMLCSITLKKRNKESEVTLKARIIRHYLTKNMQGQRIQHKYEPILSTDILLYIISQCIYHILT